MQALIVTITDMWPSNLTSVSNLSAATSPPTSLAPPTSGGGTTSISFRPFEPDQFEISDLRSNSENPFPAESPAPPAAPLTPPLQIGGDWALAPPSEEAVEVVRQIKYFS